MKTSKDQSSVGLKIEEYRKIRGLSRAKLAAKAIPANSKTSLTYQAIYYIETGRRRPGELTVIAIAEALEIPPALLFS